MKREELSEKIARAICCPGGCFADKTNARDSWENYRICDATAYMSKATAALTAIEAAGMDRNTALEDAAKELEINWGHMATPEMLKAIRAMKTERK